MSAVSINEIKKELAHSDARTLGDLCLRLARFKKDNKELLSYLLFEAYDESAYVSRIKDEISDLFDSIESRQPYLVKKTIRKILRLVNKYSRYSTANTTELELRIHFCLRFQELGFLSLGSQVLNNLFLGQVKKIRSVLVKLPEDLQYDYQSTVDALGGK